MNDDKEAINYCALLLLFQKLPAWEIRECLRIFVRRGYVRVVKKGCRPTYEVTDLGRLTSDWAARPYRRRMVPK